MVVMTAKLNKKKLAAIVVAVLAVVALLFVILKNGNSNPKAPDEPGVSVSTNDARVKFLTDFGWEVTSAPVETQSVLIPVDTTEVYDRYNALQISQGYDLTQYAGKNATRYVYQINNYPNATEPVYATLLVYKDQIIGGDITSTAADGAVQGFNTFAQMN
ncbi:MAG: DUF4830 domain-containing protein [Oscillospiraceae bacterium]|nr:DUF4830 domain-containing protein [Oscillospiraceae bacterium]